MRRSSLRVMTYFGLQSNVPGLVGWTRTKVPFRTCVRTWQSVVLRPARSVVSDHAVGVELVDVVQRREEVGAGEPVDAVGFDRCVDRVAEGDRGSPRVGARPVDLVLAGVADEVGEHRVGLLFALGS